MGASIGGGKRTVLQTDDAYFLTLSYVNFFLLQPLELGVPEKNRTEGKLKIQILKNVFFWTCVVSRGMLGFLLQNEDYLLLLFVMMAFIN